MRNIHFVETWKNVQYLGIGGKNPNPLIIDLLESIDHNAQGEFQHLIFLDCVFYLFTLL